MKKITYLFFALTLFFACSNNSASDQEENTNQSEALTTGDANEMIEEVIQTSETINLPADVLWLSMATLTGIENLIPEVISSSTVEGVGLGMKRTCKLADGSGNLHEELTKLDHENRTLEITIHSSPFPVTDYVNIMKIEKVADENTCKMVWTTRYKCTKDVAAQVKESFTGVINLAYSNMNKMAMAAKE